MQKPNFLVLASLSLALAAPLAPAFTQLASAAPGQGKQGARLKKLGAEIGLTDAQKAQMKPILMSSRQQAKAIKDDTTLSADARQAKMKELHKSTRMQMMAILTPDQKAQLKSIRKEKREEKKANG